MTKQQKPKSTADPQHGIDRANKKGNEKPLSSAASSRLPVVCLGASAGGLEILAKFFRNLPNDTGLAFVVITHLYSTHKSHMRDLLASYTSMVVKEIESGQRIEPDHVFVIPPGKNLTLRSDILLVHDVDKNVPIWHPIDFFLKSLAREKKSDSIFIILSGTGTDGSLGLKEIKAENGIVIAQLPETTPHDGMPRNAILTGKVDLILTIEQMISTLVNFVRHRRITIASIEHSDEETGDPLARIQKLFLLRMGQDLTLYKDATVVRRISRRMVLIGIKSIEEYIKLLEQDQDELEILFKDLFINVTSFFRDPEAFAVLRAKVTPALFHNKSLRNPLRVWVVGCSSGEEAYSIALLLREYMERIDRICDIQIFATDISQEAIDKARAGTYPVSIATDLGSDLFDKYFKVSDDYCTVSKPIREMIVFAQHDLLQDPPFLNLDLICCRNMLIYLTFKAQERVLHIFHHALKRGGYLFLGSAETPGSLITHYSTLDSQWKLYQKEEDTTKSHKGVPLDTLRFRTGKYREIQHNTTLDIDRTTLLELHLHRKYGHPAVLINSNLDVLHFFGDTHRFIGPPEGPPTTNLLEILKSSLKSRIKTAIDETCRRRSTVTVRNYQMAAFPEQRLNIIVEPLKRLPQAAGMMLVVFEVYQEGDLSVSEEKNLVELSRKDIVSRLEHELRSTRDQLQNIIEEKDLGNQELSSMNEELQVSNEELEASREEMQALNEELTAVNTELNFKIDELQHAYNDIDNLFVSTNLATIFVDHDLLIRRFTPAASNVFHLLTQDSGRPFGHVVCKAYYPELLDDCRKVLKSGNVQEREVTTSNGSEYLARLFPYRTQEEMVEGVVLIFLDVTEMKKVQVELQNHRERLEEMVDERTRTLAERESLLSAILHNYPGGMITILDRTHTVLFADGAGFAELNLEASHIIGKSLTELFSQEEIRFLLPHYERAFKGETVEVEITHKNKVYVLTASPLLRPPEKIKTIIAVLRDVTERKHQEEQISQLALLADQNPNPVLRLNSEGKVLYANSSACELFQIVNNDMKAAALPEKLTSTLKNIFAGREIRELEIVSDQSTYLFSLSHIPEYGYVNCYGMDITERKKAIHALEKELAITAALSRLYNSLISSDSTMEDIAKSVSKEAALLTQSSCAFTAKLDPVTRELVGHTFSWTESHSECDVENTGKLVFTPDKDGNYPGLWGYPLKSGKPFYTNEPQSHPLHKGIPKGHFQLTSLLNVPIILGDETIGQIMVANKEEGYSHEDVHAIVRLAEHCAMAFRRIRVESTAKANERLRALGEMASGIVHDINNALSPVIGYSDLLLNQQHLTHDKQKEYLEHIRTSADDIAHIISNMREFYRKRQPDELLLPIDVNRTITQVIELTRPKWKDIPQEQSVTITVLEDLEAKLPRIRCNEAEFREAITNLIFNSVDAMPDGGTITIRSRIQGDDLILEVCDTGVGMSEHVQVRCLEPMYTTKEDKGTGMGLAQVYGIVQRHGGGIEINSKQGWGTTIRLRFPLFREGETGEILDKPTADEPLPAPLRILYVDDEPSLRRLLKKMLNKDDHTVFLAEDGQKGLEIVQSQEKANTPFDVIITDLGMPNMDGREFARRISEISPETPIILLSGWSQYMETEEGMEQIFHATLNKPPTLNVLRKALRSVQIKG